MDLVDVMVDVMVNEQMKDLHIYDLVKIVEKKVNENVRAVYNF